MAALAQKAKHDWADDEDVDEVTADLPPPQTISNKDGTKTIISYRYNEMGNKVKTTRRIRFTTHREVVNPRVAERKSWAKFGESAKDGNGPAADTTSVGENIIFRPSANWKKDAKDEAKDPNAAALKDKLKDKKVKCRICNGEHFTARCPYKDTMAPIGEGGGADVAAGMGDEAAPGSASGGAPAAGAAGGGKKGSYVPPALRGDRAGAGAGERMGGGKYGERDDFATLRVTNVSVPSFITAYRILILPFTNLRSNRSLRWLKSKSCETCSSVSVASPECSWPRTERLDWQRALHSLALRIGTMRSRLAIKWTAGALSI